MVEYFAEDHPACKCGYGQDLNPGGAPPGLMLPAPHPTNPQACEWHVARWAHPYATVANLSWVTPFILSEL